MPRRNRREQRMDPRELQLLLNRDKEPVTPSGKPVSRKKQSKRRSQETQ